MSVAVICSGCGTPLPRETVNTTDLSVCPSCAGRVLVRMFPALIRKTTRDEQTGGVAVVEEGDASCFQHPSKRAVEACSKCGRFLCSICSVEIGGKTVCPHCLESVSASGKTAELETHRTLWDSIALGIGGLTVPMYPLWFISGPATVFVAIRYWKAPGSLVRRSKWRFMLAILVGTLQTVGFLMLVLGLVVALSTKSAGR